MTNKVLHRSFRPCRDYIIGLFPLYAMSFWLYGPRVLFLALTAIVTSFVCDIISAVLKGERPDLSDISSYMFALIFTAMLPASCRYEIVAIITAFIVFFAKNVFGGYGNYPFNPSAFGFALATVCWGNELFMYPRAFSVIGTGWDPGAEVVEGVAKSLHNGGLPSIDSTDLLLGNFPGPLGATYGLIILASLVLFVMHGNITFHIPVSFLLTCGVWAILLPRVQTGIRDSLLYEMFSGAVIFASVYLVSQPDTSPKNNLAKILYGILLGLGSMAYHTYGRYEVGVCFAVLLLSPLSPYFDRICSKELKFKWKGTAV